MGTHVVAKVFPLQEKQQHPSIGGYPKPHNSPLLLLLFSLAERNFRVLAYSLWATQRLKRRPPPIIRCETCQQEEEDAVGIFPSEIL